ncbi:MULTISPECIES: APC family permease [Acidiphilium]|uniref:Amino acid/polyamine/organocation transporter, APC superfamily n=1 Tax=Acidiphilium rubrum TaxID=526 RepID=A0A8G2CJQ5_ACIRU|nr:MULTISPECIES: APC family permease [Acidiphilium]MBW4036254.1 APC family permease [Pseudomonadota bacterium]OYW04156.1 MAG: amino acid permease [Acidiphilium sp. 37-64-53]OZB31091.1 MAG: amino acid permease [Acidiphilium sp. 34-64-41]SIQ57039.1 amino acid/polyamine/organocation transporter, APC superfamily [Acidiphilium rubrum]HQT83401.1 APC family permease [Acidiphilium rubrum]
MRTELRANSLSFIESIVMGIAGSAPGYTIAVTTAALIGTAGFLSPGSLIIFAVPMLGIAVAYKALTKRMANAGAAYEWTTRVFGRLFGFFSGWALLVASMVFMVTGSLPIATSTLNFIAPALTKSVLATTSVATLWFLLIAVVLIAGIKLTSKIQLVMSTIELVILAVVAIAAFVHVAAHGAVNPFSWSWFGFHYTAGGFAATALVVVFFYWGWDVTANLAEETKDAEINAGNGGFGSVFVTITYYVAFTLAALLLFTTKAAQGYSDNIIYNIAVASGLGRTGGLIASIAVILSSIATLETTMLQFSRTLFAMGRDGALSRHFGMVDERTETPVRAMYLLIGVGLVVLWVSSLMPSINAIITDSVNAIGIQVAYYYGLAGLVAAWVMRDIYRESIPLWIGLCLFPALSAIFLFAMGLYAITTFNLVTNLVGIGGLVAGIIFFRPTRTTAAPATAS